MVDKAVFYVVFLSHIKQGVNKIPGRELLLLILLPASLYDIRRYKVPNALILSAFIISLTGYIDKQGISGIYPWLTGTIVPFILTYFFYKLRMLGASDVKIFSVTGSFIGVGSALQIMVTSIFTGAVIALLYAAKRKNLRRRLSCFILYLYKYQNQDSSHKKLIPYYDREKEKEDGIIPFTPAIVLAVILCLF